MADDRYGERERRQARSNSIFGDDDRDRERGGYGAGEDRGFLERAGEKIGSWLGGDEGGSSGGGSGGGERHRQNQYGSQHGYGGFQGDYGGGSGQGGFGGEGDYGGGRQSFSGGSQNERFSGSEHEHYRNWRDRQIAELDRDYEEYCRERQQLFHSDFGSWRQGRQRGPAGQSDLGASTGSSGTSALLGDPSHTGPGGDATGEAMSETGGGRSDS